MNRPQKATYHAEHRKGVNIPFVQCANVTRAILSTYVFHGREQDIGKRKWSRRPCQLALFHPLPPPLLSSSLPVFRLTFFCFTLAWNVKRGVDPRSANYASRLISNSRIERYCLQSTQIPGTRRCLYTLVFGLATRFFALSFAFVYILEFCDQVINDSWNYICLVIYCVAYLFDIRVCPVLFVFVSHFGSLEKYDCVHVFLNFFLETRGKRGSFKFNITTTVFCVSGFVSFVSRLSFYWFIGKFFCVVWFFFSNFISETR